jgi:hypothetical protein
LILGVLMSVAACGQAPSAEAGSSSSTMERPRLGHEHKRCDRDDECHLWSADYSAAGCCPAACDGEDDDPVAVNLDALYMLDQHCYGKVVPRCDHSDAKISCGEQPRVAACVDGTCRVRERGKP